MCSYKMWRITLILLFWATSSSSIMFEEESENESNRLKRSIQGCIPPANPPNGAYKLNGIPHEMTEDMYQSLKLTYICNRGYILLKNDVVECKNGTWTDTSPVCVPSVMLNPFAPSVTTSTTTTTTVRPTQSTLSSTVCEMPANLRGGKYRVPDKPNAAPGEVFNSLYLMITCEYGYSLQGAQAAFCIKGQWSGDLPRCVRVCQLYKHPSVTYTCMADSSNSRPCNDEEPSGTQVQPQCNSYYTYSGTLSTMICEDGSWNYVAICSPTEEQKYADCGIPSGNVPLIIGGEKAVRGEVPWHVGIYTKDETENSQICGGSLVTNSIIISAAHCFWDDLEGKLPPSNYAVAVGKLYRKWSDSRDLDTQMSDVRDIIIPALFQGNAANFQEDIALVVVTTPFVYRNHVRPVCINFDFEFERRQLQKGNLGKVAGWGLTSENGTLSKFLKVAQMPFVTQSDCIRGLPPSYVPYVTSDKICAGYTTGTAVCRGDSGGGLAFPEKKNGVVRYYLRGIVSTAPNSGNECNAYSWATFTNINRHQHLMRDYL